MKKETLRDQLVHFTLCQGIGATASIQMIAALIDQPTSSLYELSQLVGLSASKRTAFITSYHKINFEEIKKLYQKMHIGWVTILDDDYPDYLKHIYNPPAVLFYQGNKELLRKKMLAVVGARKNTLYGVRALKQILPGLIASDFLIVSGLATGIDYEAHQLTLELSGETIGVVGTGLDLCYPKENQDLQKKLAKEHLVISEYPLGTKPLKQHFPMRNRIISGLAIGTLVIEAAARSGSLITANLALAEGREVFALPGNITSSLSTGTNELISKGAKCVTKTEDILEEFYQ
ncbi:DNA-processing protein DprA [Carnobacterium maltaromaticum]|jgi:DNA processing protein|uniref:DNA-processing protein DprA n=1 Tax=Carnobacterium maltaromaticum TaxID=2751 RepID=UPI000550869F|nr:DNA-processing protein DprA [Carnobacterium maltaromaticum]AOA01971.1 DNA protecting protein DprA [Carnobacterium maltaromaticum]KRN64578.1 putative DNA processing protein DprA [Carnobacterium maltaromaticum DSM 20342]MCI1818947.1 DNA-processing protein DprA [Carnobacterium maltaromaticum]